jgi:hypothetical protein
LTLVWAFLPYVAMTVSFLSLYAVRIRAVVLQTRLHSTVAASREQSDIHSIWRKRAAASAPDGVAVTRVHRRVIRNRRPISKGW